MACDVLRRKFAAVITRELFREGKRKLTPIEATGFLRHGIIGAFSPEYSRCTHRQDDARSRILLFIHPFGITTYDANSVFHCLFGDLLQRNRDGRHKTKYSPNLC